MFNEKKFIDDFIDENYRDNLEDRDIKYSEIEEQIRFYGKRVIANCSDDDLKYISELYTGKIWSEDYKLLAIEAIYNLYPKILSEYIDFGDSDNETTENNENEYDEEEYDYEDY